MQALTGWWELRRGRELASEVLQADARHTLASIGVSVAVLVGLGLVWLGYPWADPAVTRNCHQIRVEADSASFTMSIENVPSENPKTGRITALSVIAALRKLTSPLQVGT